MQYICFSAEVFLGQFHTDETLRSQCKRLLASLSASRIGLQTFEEVACVDHSLWAVDESVYHPCFAFMDRFHATHHIIRVGLDWQDVVNLRQDVEPSPRKHLSQLVANRYQSDYFDIVGGELKGQSQAHRLSKYKDAELENLYLQALESALEKGTQFSFNT